MQREISQLTLNWQSKSYIEIISKLQNSTKTTSQYIQANQLKKFINPENFGCSFVGQNLMRSVVLIAVNINIMADLALTPM
jgi:hypothetical protein